MDADGFFRDLVSLIFEFGQGHHELFDVEEKDECDGVCLVAGFGEHPVQRYLICHLEAG